MTSHISIKRAFFAALAIGFLTALPAYAATLDFGETYTLSSGDSVSGNLYVTGGTVIISGPVDGDALFVGGDTTISGEITDDVFFIAGSGEVLGDVGGDVRAAGGKLTFAEHVGGDALLAGGAVSLVSGSQIQGDAILAGGRVSLLGDVGGNVYIGGADIFIDGKIVGNVTIYSSGQIHIGPNAAIGGSFSYRSPEEALIDAKAVIKGETTFEYLAPVLTARDVKGFFAGLVGVAFIVRLLALVLAALFFVLSFRRMTGEFSRFSLEHFWKAVLIGFIIFVAVPFASLIILLTVFGGFVALSIFLAWVSLLLLAQIYAGVVFWNIVCKYLFKRELPPVISWQTAVLGTLVLGVVCLIPYVGPLIGLVFFLASLGAFSEIVYRKVILSR